MLVCCEAPISDLIRLHEDYYLNVALFFSPDGNGANDAFFLVPYVIEVSFSKVQCILSENSSFGLQSGDKNSQWDESVYKMQLLEIQLSIFRSRARLHSA